MTMMRTRKRDRPINRTSSSRGGGTFSVQYTFNSVGITLSALLVLCLAIMMELISALISLSLLVYVNCIYTTIYFLFSHCLHSFTLPCLLYFVYPTSFKLTFKTLDTLSFLFTFSPPYYTIPLHFHLHPNTHHHIFPKHILSSKPSHPNFKTPLTPMSHSIPNRYYGIAVVNSQGKKLKMPRGAVTVTYQIHR